MRASIPRAHRRKPSLPRSIAGKLAESHRHRSIPTLRTETETLGGRLVVQLRRSRRRAAPRTARSSAASSRAARDKSAEAGRGATEPKQGRPCARQTSPRQRFTSVTAQTRSNGCHQTPTKDTTAHQRLRGRRSARPQPSRVTSASSHQDTRRTRATRQVAINSAVAPTPCESQSHKPQSSKASRPTTPGEAQRPGNSSRSATPSLPRSPAMYSWLRYSPARTNGSAPARVEAPSHPRAGQRRPDRVCAHDTIHHAGRRKPNWAPQPVQMRWDVRLL